VSSSPSSSPSPSSSVQSEIAQVSPNIPTEPSLSQLQQISTSVAAIRALVERPSPPPPRKSLELDHLQDIKKLLVDEILPKITQISLSNNTHSNPLDAPLLQHTNLISPLPKTDTSEIALLQKKMDSLESQIHALSETLQNTKQQQIDTYQHQVGSEDHVLFLVFMVLLLLAAIRAI